MIMTPYENKKTSGKKCQPQKAVSPVVSFIFAWLYVVMCQSVFIGDALRNCTPTALCKTAKL